MKTKPARKPAHPAHKSHVARNGPRHAPNRKPKRVRASKAAPAMETTLAAEPAEAPLAPEREDASRPRAITIARAGLAKKAEEVTVIDVRGLTSYADYFVIMTADSDRQAGAIVDQIDETLRAEGASRVGIEGQESGRWVLIDYGDVVAHVFSSEARGFYDLEGLWADAPRFRVEG